MLVLLSILAGREEGQAKEWKVQDTILCGETTSIRVLPGHRAVVLAGGCFWGTQAYMQRMPGVMRTFAAYVNGRDLDPGYRTVCSGTAGHAEAVFVEYDPQRIDLTHLLRYFFMTINPTSRNRQGNDVGVQYRTGVYALDEADLPVIMDALQELQAGHENLVAVEAQMLQNISVAEPEHQDYLAKNPSGYCHVSFASLPDPSAVLVGEKAEENVALFDYQKPSPETLKTLPRSSWQVTQEGATERPFSSAHTARTEEGIYVDITTGQPLFSSLDKFDAGCGWPSFSRPLNEHVVREKADLSLGMPRTEVRSTLGDAHLGHVFADGPQKTGGLRYCINGAALRFISRKDMELQGYGYLLSLFEK